MNPEKQKQLATSVLNDLIVLGIVDPNALVAGGAPRNWEFGMKARDIDIFACRSDYYQSKLGNDSYENVRTEASKKMMAVNNFKSKTESDRDFWSYAWVGAVEHDLKKIYPSMSEVVGKSPALTNNGYKKGVFEFRIEDQLFQIIFCPNPLNVILGFDFGINKIWMNNFGEVTKFWQFDIDKKNKRLTHWPEYNDSSNSYNKLPERKDKMLQYFPDFIFDMKNETEDQRKLSAQIVLDHNTFLNTLEASIRKKNTLQKLTEGEGEDDEVEMANGTILKIKEKYTVAEKFTAIADDDDNVPF